MNNIIDVAVQRRGSVPRFMLSKKAFLLLGVVALAGCVGPSCQTGLAPMTSAELYFGLSMPEGAEVTAEAWQRFVDEEITPRFPDGLTVEDAQGQWKGATAPVRERAKHLTIILPHNDPSKLDAIRAAYKHRFHQESVLLVATPVCGSF